MIGQRNKNPDSSETSLSFLLEILQIDKFRLFLSLNIGIYKSANPNATLQRLSIRIGMVLRLLVLLDAIICPHT